MIPHALFACIQDRDPPLYSCDESSLSAATCVEYAPMSAESADYGQGYCTSRGGTWSTARCPTANLLASCDMPGVSVQYWYVGYAGTLTDVEPQCTGRGGTWTWYPQ